MQPRVLCRFLALVSLAVLSACGGGGDDPVAREDALGRPSFSVGGTITLDVPLPDGSPSSIMLSLDGAPGEMFNVSASGGSFTFARQLFNRGTYNVSVETTVAGYNCSVTSGGSGMISRSNVTNVAVSCLRTYSVGGTITGVVSPPFGDAITLSLDGAYVEPFNATASGGVFTFNRRLVNDDTYNVSVAATVAGYNCSVASGGSGTISRSNVTDVAVSCVLIPRYDVLVSVSGLPGGSSVVIQNNGAGNRITATANTIYNFPVPQYADTNYLVSIVTQPAGASCTVPQPFGTVTAGMSPIAVQCTPN